MIGIVLISHARMASETKNALEHVLGTQTSIEAVDVSNFEFSKEDQEKFKALVATADQGQGVLVMADLFGSTPCNIALSLLQQDKVEVVAGFNLPCVIKAATLREKDISLVELAKTTISAGQQYICLGSDFQRGKPGD